MNLFPGRLHRPIASLALCTCFALQAGAAGPAFQFDSLPAARFEFTGPVGDRVKANVEHWLLRAPQANPGMIEMFRLRDRQPVPNLVPWSGEFVGKYLISAVQALRMTLDSRLSAQVTRVVNEFIGTQAEDGYLGPFPKPDRLLKNWDLWGHYHAIQALLMWHQHSGDSTALAAARRAADLVCRTYLDTGRRVFDAGDPEMNMSILTGLAMLHRLTGEPRYLRMAREVEKDWERAGDYLRAGLDGREFYRSPRPRWESLHDLQGLVEMWRITGDARYREAFEHHWRSMRRWDRRNTGGFSSGEQATGNPYAPTPIETCCTVAWMALTIDYLRLTGDARAADDLELATLNGGLGAQHPSGRWWTYNTPMDGVREASAHTIVFQARAGTPELNCCSVNAPRVLGMLSEWAVMAAPDGVVINSYLPGKYTVPREDGDLVFAIEGDYPRGESCRVRLVAGKLGSSQLHLRLPGWSARTAIFVGNDNLGSNPPGTYKVVPGDLLSKPGAFLEVFFDTTIRAVPGAREAAGKVSLYRGPLLLAYDQAQNDVDEDAMPVVDLARLKEAKAVTPADGVEARVSAGAPWLKVDVITVDGRPLRLVDFANAGAAGTRYRSWLEAAPVLPQPVSTESPPDGARVPLAPVPFRWQSRRSGQGLYRIEFSTNPRFAALDYSTNVSGRSVVLDPAPLSRVAGPDRVPLFWRVVSRDVGRESWPDVPPAWFRFDSEARALPAPPELKLGPDREVVVHSLRGEGVPEFGPSPAGAWALRDASGTELNGRDQMLVYRVPVWPEEDFSVSVRVRIGQSQQKRMGQVFSAWAAGMDDPLRIVFEGGRLFARIEAGNGFSTAGVPVEAGHWYAVAAVKQGGSLRLYLDGREVGACAAPAFTNTPARDCALGGNPHYSGNEFLAAQFADFRFHARAMSPEELAAQARSP